MADSAMWALGENFALEANAPAPGWGTMVGRNVYTCADGRQVTVACDRAALLGRAHRGAGAPRNSPSCAHSLGADPSVTRPGGRRSSRPSRRRHWCENPGYAGGVGPVNSVADLLTDPAMIERGSIVPLAGIRESGCSPTRSVRGGASGDRGEASSHGLTDPPDLGADTDAALAAAGYTPEEIAALRAEKIVA